MTRFLVLVVIAGCAGIPGDPNTLVVNGDAKAGYAWSGPDSFCCTPDVKDVAAWQVWFTNTEQCPTTGKDAIATLQIISTETVQRPSTELPQLTTMTLPLAFPDVMFTEPAALFGVTGEIGESSGTVSLTTYSAEEITGVVRARGQDINGKPLDIVATFDAHRCDRIHD